MVAFRRALVAAVAALILASACTSITVPTIPPIVIPSFDIPSFAIPSFALP